MRFFQILKNYLFSSNNNILNPSYRFSPIFYKRFFTDFILRVFTFTPFILALFYLMFNGYFKEFADVMLQSGQNLYGYLLVIFIYIPIFLFFITSLLVSILGIALKRTVFTPNNEELTQLPHKYNKAFITSWKNLWYLNVETFLVLLFTKFVLEMYVERSFSISFMVVVQASLVTLATSGILASLISLPWLSKKNQAKENSDNNINNNTVVASE